MAERYPHTTIQCLAAIAQHHRLPVNPERLIEDYALVAEEPPEDWSPQRRREYLDWSERVVMGCRGVNPALESIYDQALAEGRRVLDRRG